MSRRAELRMGWACSSTSWRSPNGTPIASGQLTSKTGVKSLAKKMDSSRHGFDRPPASHKTAGAFGKEEVRGAVTDSTSGTTRRSKREALDRMKGTT
jgi:hypothetical protein